MEDQEILNLETGTKEIEKLSPKEVKIEKVEIQNVTFGDKINQKAMFSVKHPDRDEIIQISSVKFEAKGGKLITSGLWVNFDEDNKLRKGSALANFIAFKNIKVLSDLVNVRLETTEDEKGYLCFKGY